MRKVFWEAVATMVGTIIGAGVLGLPFAVAKAGFWTGIVCIFVVGLAALVLYLYLGEIVLRTRGFHQLTGYCEKYLGKNGKRLMAFAMVFGIYGALIAYLIGEGQALSAVFGVGNPVFYSLVFFFVVSSIIYLGLQTVAESELYILPVMILIIIAISFLSFDSIDSQNFVGFSVFNLLAPFGVVLFAFLGSTAIPEMEQELVKHRSLLRSAVIVGLLIPFVVYLLFAVVVVGVTGVHTSEVATIGLGSVIGPWMVIFGNLFAVFSMTTSFLALGLALQQMYEYDYGLNRNLSWVLTCIIPLIVTLAGVTSFIKAIDLAGIVSGGITGVLIVLMFEKAKKMGDRKPEFEIKARGWLSFLLIALFVVGAGYYFLVHL